MPWSSKAIGVGWMMQEKHQLSPAPSSAAVTLNAHVAAFRLLSMTARPAVLLKANGAQAGNSAR